MQKRVLPPRINRGRRPQPSQQQDARDEIIYNHIFQKAMKQVPKSPAEKSKIQAKLESAQNQLQHRQFYSTNRVCYPYSRGYHYFFELNTFPREEHSVSYAVDEHNLFNTTYSQDNKIIKDNFTVGQLFNRKLFGLPVCYPAHLGIKTKDKNICHSYLFVNQDRKFNIDRSIYELRHIHDHFDQIQRKGSINKFSCLKKDVDLLSILQDQLSVQEKKAILAKKIKILVERKQSMKNFVMLEDKFFFHHSLNQRLHDNIQEKIEQLSDSYIIEYLYVYDRIRAKISQCQQKQRKSQLKKLLSYTQIQKQCVSEGMVEQINKRLGTRFYQKQENSQLYLISAPFMIFNFSNLSIMTVCEKVLALKCAHQSEALFYMCKLFWKRIFDRDLVLNKEFKPLTRPEYDKAMNLIVIQLQRWKKQQQRKGELKSMQQIVCPIIDPVVDLSVFQPEPKSFDLFRIQNEVQISIREYISIQLFYQLYLSMAEIYEFILTNGLLTELIAGDFFNRGNNFITEIMGSVRVGLIQQILRKLTENIIKQDIISPNFKLKLVYNEQLGVAYIIKSSPQSDWETEKEQENELDEQKIESKELHKDESQEIIDQGPQKRVFK